MSTLVFNFEAGFSNDKVKIIIDNAKTIEREEVSSDYASGLAATVESEVESGKHEVSVLVTTSNLEQRFSIEVTETKYIRVWIDELGNLIYKIQDEMQYYF
jgi:hypothetical protein